MTPQQRLAALLEDVGDTVTETTVRVSLLRALLGESPPTATATEIAIDLTAEEVGRLLQRDPSLVRSLCRAGSFADAYKMAGREWRIPATSIERFQRDQQRAYGRATHHSPSERAA